MQYEWNTFHTLIFTMYGMYSTHNIVLHLLNYWKRCLRRQHVRNYIFVYIVHGIRISGNTFIMMTDVSKHSHVCTCVLQPRKKYIHTYIHMYVKHVYYLYMNWKFEATITPHRAIFDNNVRILALKIYKLRVAMYNTYLSSGGEIVKLLLCAIKDDVRNPLHTTNMKMQLRMYVCTYIYIACALTCIVYELLPVVLNHFMKRILAKFC